MEQRELMVLLVLKNNYNKTSKMFSEKDIKTLIHDAFNEEDGLRAEIKSDIKTELKLATFQVFTAIGVTMIVSIVSVSIYLANLRSDVDNLQNNQFNSDQASVLRERIEVNTEAIKEAATGDNLQRVEETLIRLDERIRNSWI